MSNDLQELLQDARQWVEQEKAWDESLYATPGEGKRQINRDGGLTDAAGNPKRQREEVLSTDTSHRSFGHPAVAAPRPSGAPPSSHKSGDLQDLYTRYKDCVLCPLGNSRLKFVFGVGSPDAEVMVIGEGPGYEEDHRGEPFVGKSGQLLDKMLEAIGLSRKTVYIANIVKCHAMINPDKPEERGNDRAPTSLESETCSPILQQQIAIIQPKMILTLGSPSTRAILMTTEGISKIRGRLFPFPMAYFKSQTADSGLFDEKNKTVFPGFSPDQLASLAGLQVLPTYHPAALLRNPNLKKDAWEDMKLLRDTLRAHVR